MEKETPPPLSLIYRDETNIYLLVEPLLYAK